MKTMNRYTIYCTAEQTKKALNLDAQLKIDEGKGTILCKYKNYNTYKRVVIPTAEQMIGWLETLINFIDVIRQENDTWLYIVYPESHNNKNITAKGFSSRKEATLAAIDAVLEYLSKNKK